MEFKESLADILKTLASNIGILPTTARANNIGISSIVDTSVRRNVENIARSAAGRTRDSMGVSFANTPLTVQNPCLELELPNAILIDGQHRMMAHQFIGENYLTGSPYMNLLGKAQHHYVARAIFDYVYPLHHDTPIVRALPYTNLNKKVVTRFRKLAQLPYTNQLIHGFYNQNVKPSWWTEYGRLKRAFVTQRDVSAYLSYLTTLYYDAIGFGHEVTLNQQYRTDSVLGLIKNIRATEDWALMPILADALQDADWPHEALLKHYRESKLFSLGSWIFRTSGLL